MNVGGRAQNIHYAKSGDLNIAFSVTGEGPDLVVAPGFISHLDIMGEEPSIVHFSSRPIGASTPSTSEALATQNRQCTIRRWMSRSTTCARSWMRQDVNAPTS